MRYSDDPVANAFVAALIASFAPNPWDRHKTNRDKTIGAILDLAREKLGDFTRGIRITVH
jgi:hypothetical protein